MKEKIMPPLVLMLISAIVCGLLVLANSATKDKIVKAQEEKFSNSLTETFGEADYKITDLSYDGITSVTTGVKLSSAKGGSTAEDSTVISASSDMASMASSDCWAD